MIRGPGSALYGASAGGVINIFTEQGSERPFLEAGATLDGIVGALHAMAERPSSVDELPRIAAPTLIVVGREDVITPVADAETMAAAIPGAQLTIIPDAGHLTPLEQPEAVNAAIRTWLAATLT